MTNEPIITPLVGILPFATLGAVQVMQDLVRAIVTDIETVDPEKAAEETLCLVSTATARTVEAALKEWPALSNQIRPALLDLPFTYRDYLIGSAIIAQNDPELAVHADIIGGRLQRMMQFYTVHLPAGQFPGKHILTDKMALWMGRISPPRLPENPTSRLGRLNLVSVLLTHLRLVLAYTRKEGQS